MSALPDDDLEEGYTMEYLLRERGYSEEYIQSYLKRRSQKDNDNLDKNGETGATESAGQP